MNLVYEEVKDSIFYEDDGFRDIYIRPTDMAAWETLYAYFIKNYQSRFIVDGEQATAPKTAQEALDLRKNHNPLLSIFVGPIRVNVHFFTSEEFEADIDPSEIKDQSHLNHLLKWMREIGVTVQRDVLLTPEGSENDVLLQFNSSSNSFIRS